MSFTSICNRSRIFFSSSNSDSNCLISRFCWSFMVSMMVLSSRTCILSSSIAAWLLTAGSIFGFPSVLNRDGELALCPAVPKEDDMGEDATEEREAGPLLAAAMVPGLGGRDVLLSDTWDMVTVLEVFFDTSIPLCASEMCSSLSSSGLGESKISGLEREEDVSDWDGGRLPVAFGLLVVGWLSFSVDDITESKPSKSISLLRSERSLSRMPESALPAKSIFGLSPLVCEIGRAHV